MNHSEFLLLASVFIGQAPDATPVQTTSCFSFLSGKGPDRKGRLE